MRQVFALHTHTAKKEMTQEQTTNQFVYKTTISKINIVVLHSCLHILRYTNARTRILTATRALAFKYTQNSFCSLFSFNSCLSYLYMVKISSFHVKILVAVRIILLNNDRETDSTKRRVNQETSVIQFTRTHTYT